MKGRIVQAGSKNLTPTQKFSTTGHQRFMPLKEFEGKVTNAQGEREAVGPEAWVDFHTNKSYPAGKDWSNPPPALPSGDPGAELRCRPPSPTYRRRYAEIFGHQ